MEITNIGSTQLLMVLLTIIYLLIYKKKNPKENKIIKFKNLLIIFASFFISIFMAIGLTLLERLQINPINYNIIYGLIISIFFMVPFASLMYIFAKSLTPEIYIDDKSKKTDPNIALAMIPFNIFLSLYQMVSLFLEDTSRTSLLSSIGILLLFLVISSIIFFYLEIRKSVKKGKGAYYIGNTFITIGAAFIFIYCYNIYQNEKFIPINAKYVEKIKELSEEEITTSEDGKTRKIYYVFEYEINGNKYEYDFDKSETPEYELGDELSIYYKKDSYTSSYPKKLPTKIHIILGVISIFIGVLINKIKEIKESKLTI